MALPCYRPSRSTISSTRFLTIWALARPLLCFMTCPTILLSTFLFPARNAAISLGRARIAASQSNCNSERGEDDDSDWGDESEILERAISCSSLASWVGVCEVGFVSIYLRRNFPDVPMQEHHYLSTEMRSESKINRPVTVPFCTRSISSPNWSTVSGFSSNVCFRIDSWPISSINLVKRMISWRLFYQKNYGDKHTSSKQAQDFFLSLPVLDCFLLDKAVQSNSQLLQNFRHQMRLLAHCRRWEEHLNSVLCFAVQGNY